MLHTFRTVIKHVMTEHLIQESVEQQRKLASKVVPWFMKSMPAAYFRNVSQNLRLQHVKAIMLFRETMDSDSSLKLQVKDEEGIKHTVINGHGCTGLFKTQVNNLVVPGHHLTNVDIFSSSDGDVILSVCSFQPSEGIRSGPTRKSCQKVFDLIEEIKSGKHIHDPRFPKFSESISESSIQDFLNRVTPIYAEQSSGRRILIEKQMFDKKINSDCSIVHIEPHTGSDADAKYMSWVTIAASKSPPNELLELESTVLISRGLHISGCHLYRFKGSTNVNDALGGDTIIRFLVSPIDKSKNLNTNIDFANDVARDIRRIKWLDDSTIELGLKKYPQLGLDNAEIITALSSLLCGPLNKLDSSLTTTASILKLLECEQSFILGERIAVLFLDRFNPISPLPNYDFQRRSDEIYHQISTHPVKSVRLALKKMLDAVHATLRTNFYNSDRYALSLRLNPTIMNPPEVQTSEHPLPFGVFFCHGRYFNAFHNRFRDISRGPLHIISPQSACQYAVKSARLYDEAYDVSHSWQLANKDVPEGGSAGVILINSHEKTQEYGAFVKSFSVQAFTDSLLDLLVQKNGSELVDFYGKEENLFLFPDEECVPSLDNQWILDRAHQRGYDYPTAFARSMTYFPFYFGNFANATSEGVMEVLDVATRTQWRRDFGDNPFTVKITGGLNDHLVGFLVYNLIRDFGTKCKIVGIADDVAFAEDPNGLDHSELLRLVSVGMSIDKFNKAKLSAEGTVFSADINEVAIDRLNSFGSRVKSDVFIPAARGRHSITSENCLDDMGRPSSPIMINLSPLFISPEACSRLFNNGHALVIPYNSGSTIQMSVELMASMLLDREEFNSIKYDLMNETVAYVRQMARREGEILFQGFRFFPGPMNIFSVRLQFAMAKVKDAVAASLAHIQADDPLLEELRPIICATLPKTLTKVAGSRVSTRLPIEYQRSAIASGLATLVVHHEGYAAVECQPFEKIAEHAIAYYRGHKQVQRILGDLENIDFGTMERYEDEILYVLKRSGARTISGSFRDV